jgi:hypothetical protein
MKLPIRKVDVVTARAVFNADYRWVNVIALAPDPAWFNDNFSQFEQEAISLGLKMWRELNKSNLVIVNDNQSASRNYVKLADQLKIEQATRIFFSGLEERKSLS